MSFETNVIPASGLDLLANAAGSTLHITKALGYIYFYSQHQLETGAYLSDEPALQASIDSISTIGSTCTITTGFTSQDEDVNIRTVVLFAKIDNGVEQPLLCVSDSVKYIRVFSSNSTLNARVQVALSISIYADTTVTAQVAQMGYLTTSEASRFVSTHSAGSSVQGDYQSILGEKSFESRVDFYDYVYLNDSIYIETSNADSPASLTVGTVGDDVITGFIEMSAPQSIDIAGGHINIHGDSINATSIDPYQGSDRNPRHLGTSTNKWEGVHANYFHGCVKCDFKEPPENNVSLKRGSFVYLCRYITQAEIRETGGGPVKGVYGDVIESDGTNLYIYNADLRVKGMELSGIRRLKTGTKIQILSDYTKDTPGYTQGFLAQVIGEAL